MEDAVIVEKLKSILKNHTSIKTEVTRETALLGGNVIDSMDFMNYITIVEETFKITISDDDIPERKLGVIGNLAKYIREKTS